MKNEQPRWNGASIQDPRDTVTPHRLAPEMEDAVTVRLPRTYPDVAATVTENVLPKTLGVRHAAVSSSASEIFRGLISSLVCVFAATVYSFT